ncbi:MAG: ABC transporter permease [Chlamydiae bacterium]|nr:ABC transporter permease [Chlamydiota bacterium]MBI3265517.1 ABC transporter permease [Chlamydiota bacterium]
MKFKMFLKLCFASISHQKGKSALMMIVSVMAVAVTTSLLGLIYDVRLQMQKELMAFGPNFKVQPQWNTIGNMISWAQYDEIEKMFFRPDAIICPVLAGVVLWKDRSQLIEGVLLDAYQKISKHWIVEGTWPNKPGEVLVGEKVAQKFHLKLGETLTFDQSSQAFLIRGFFRSGTREEEKIVFSMKGAQKILKEEKNFSFVFARLNNSLQELENLSENIEKHFPDLKAVPIRRVSLAEGAILDRIGSLVGWVNILILMVAALALMATSTVLVDERREEFGLQRALGASPAQLMRLFYMETFLSAFIVSPLGFLLGFWGLKILAYEVFSAQATFRWEMVPVILIVLMVVILLGESVAVRRIATLEPAMVLKGE